MQFFKHFPQITYSLKDVETKRKFEHQTVNLMVRAGIPNGIRQQVDQALGLAYYPYTIGESETYETVAFDVYGSVDYAWVVLFSNNIVSIEKEWPKDYSSFQNHILKKYGSVATAMSTIHAYYQIVAPKRTLYDGTFIDAIEYEVDKTTYDSLTAANRRLVYAYQHEEQLNEDKRSIRLVRSGMLPRLERQLKTIFKA